MSGPEQSEEEALANIATVVQGIEQFIAAGQNAEASELLEQLIPVIAHGITFVEEADDLGLYSGLALACARLQRLQDAENYARRAIIENPLDLLAHALLAPEIRITIARQLIHHQRPDIARDLLKTLGMTGQSDDGGFYLEALDFFDTQKALARQLAPSTATSETRPTLINLAVWGEPNVRKCLSYAVPSLLAPGNIPALAQNSSVILDVYTAEEDRDRLLGDPLFDTIRKFAEVRTTIIPETLLGHMESEATPDPALWCIAGAQYSSAVAARHLDADLVFAEPNAVYSESYLSGAKQFIEDGIGGVVTTALLSTEDAMTEGLAAHRDTGSREIEIDSAGLLFYATERISEQVRDSFIQSDATAVDHAPVAISFATEDGFSTHCFKLIPAMMSCDLLPDDIVFDFLAADIRFLAELADGRDAEALLKVIEEPIGDIAVVRLDDEGESGDEQMLTPESTAKAGLDLCHKESDLPYFLWAFRQHFTVECEDQAGTLPDSDLAEADTIETVIDHIEEGLTETVHRIRFYSGAYR